MSLAASHTLITPGGRRRSTAASVAIALPWRALPEVVRMRASRPRASCPSTASLMSVDRHLAQPLDEAPAVAFEVERLAGAIVRAMVVQRTGDLRTCLARALVVRIDVVDVHADVRASCRSPPRPREGSSLSLSRSGRFGSRGGETIFAGRE